MLENMIEPISSPSTRVHFGPRFALRPIILLVLAVLFFTALLFAADAQASGDTPGGATDAPIGETATNGDTPSEQSGSSTGEQLPSIPAVAPPTTEQAPPAVGQSAGEESVSAVEQTPPVNEQTPPAAEQSQPATEQPTVPAEASPPTTETTTPTPAEQSPPTVGETAPPVVLPPVEPPPVVVETPPTVEHVAKEPSLVEESAPVVDKKTTEQTAGDLAAEAGSETIQGSGEGSQAPVDTSGSTHKDTAAVEVAPGTSTAVTAPAAPAVLSETSMPSAQDQSSLAFPAPPTLVHGAGQASCELAAFGASIATGDVHGLLVISAVTAVSTAPLATVEASPAATTAGGSADGDGGSVVGHPFSPTPGPGSGGAGSGSAAAGGGSGSASSAPFTLVGALLQAAPRAMRRLLLAQQSWRTSFLVLIPERPD
jgi:hypothetical protein